MMASPMQVLFLERICRFHHQLMNKIMKPTFNYFKGGFGKHKSDPITRNEDGYRRYNVIVNSQQNHLKMFGRAVLRAARHITNFCRH